MMMREARSGVREAGFGLIELIVVIALIGIVTGIAVPSFVGVRNGVRDAATLSDLRSNRTALVEYSVDNNGAFPPNGFNPRSTTTNLIGYGWSQAAETTSFRYSLNSTGSAWCLDMTNETGSVFYVTTNSKGSQSGSCTSISASSY